MSETFDVFHDDKSLSNKEAPLNIYLMLVTDEVSQLDKTPLKRVA